MKEIQSVMFNMGIVSDFSTHVSKDVSGKNYHNELANEVESFLNSVVDKMGGVVGLIDLYCMYNRARGTDMISPEDMKLACIRLNQVSSRYMLKEYASGVKTIQSRMFNESKYFEKIVDTIKKENRGLTAVQIAEALNINVVLMKEHMA